MVSILLENHFEGYFSIGLQSLKEWLIMATTGSVDFNLTKISNVINNSTQVAADVTGGIADQGDLIGTAIGITIAVVLLIGAIAAVLGIIFVIFNFAKRLKGTKI